MGKGMRERRHLLKESLLKKATQDFELARKYRDAKELVTASLLYNSAIEKVLKALIMAKTRRKPPEKASLEYLATQARLPEEMAIDLSSMDDEMEDIMEEELEMENLQEYKHSNIDQKEYNNVLNKSNIVRRLISYAEASK